MKTLIAAAVCGCLLASGVVVGSSLVALDLPAGYRGVDSVTKGASRQQSANDTGCAIGSDLENLTVTFQLK